MVVTINGESRPFDRELTLAELLDALAIQPDGMAAVVRGEIVRAPEFAATTLVDGDEVEIVRMVGGG